MNAGLKENYGFGDWRVPNIKELRSLLSYETESSALPSGHPFTIYCGHSWASTTSLSDGTERAWMVAFFDMGDQLSNDKTLGGAPGWPVRDGSKNNEHLPIRPVPGEIMLGYNQKVPWAHLPHNGIDYDSNLSDEVKSVGTGVIYPYTKPNAGRFGSIDPDGKGPAIWVRYKLSTGEPIYVLYGHTASSWVDSSKWIKNKFKFNCTYYIDWNAGDIVNSNTVIGYSASFYHSGTHQEHLHLSVFKPKKKKDGSYYGPPSSGWGYSNVNLPTGTYVDPEVFFTQYKLTDDIEP